MRCAWIVGVVAALCAVAHAKEPAREPCAIVVVIDRAMGADKLELVTQAVTAGLASLDRNDQIAVVSLSRAAQIALPLQSAANQTKITAAVGRIRSGDGANLVAGLETAFGMLKKVKHKAKHVVVISDGTSVLGVQPLAAKMIGAGIRISAVGVQSLNRTALQYIADTGGGQDYMLERPAQLAKVFSAARLLTKRDHTQAVVLVIDRSGSMSGEQLGLAKQLAQGVIEVLSPNDLVAVVTFDRDVAVAAALQRASNRMRLSNEVARVQSGGAETNIYAGLKAAFELLTPITADAKHVILLSDGKAPTDGIVELVTDIKSAKVTVSAVGVSGADRSVLAMIADAGDGRLYMGDDFSSLPRMLVTPQISN